MKYFTPELYARLQSSDPTEMDAADDAWRKAEASYQRRLQRIRAKLPKTVQAFIDEVRLHDAEVLWIGRARNDLWVLLRPESTSTSTIRLNYSRPTDIQFNTQAFPGEYVSSTMQWMYDEFDTGDAPDTFHHSILFSNGWSLDVAAAKLQIVPVGTLYTAGDARIAV
jgi:hypothetical protein